jgi:hypothetical protein
MTGILLRFFKRLAFVTVLLALVIVVVFGFFLKQYYIPVLPFVLLFFFLFTFLTYSYQVYVTNKGFGKFTRASLLMTMIRLLVYAAVTALLIAFFKEDAACLFIVIGVFYIVFTFFEVTEVSSYARSSGIKKNNDDCDSVAHKSG